MSILANTYPTAPAPSVPSVTRNIDYSQTTWNYNQKATTITNSTFSIKISSEEEDREFRLLNHNLQKLNRIANYDDNWNGYGAKAFNSELLEKAKEIILNLHSQPEVFPTANNSIQIEWEKPSGEYLEIQVTLTDQWEVFQIDANDKTSEAIIPADTSAINKLVEQFYANAIQ